MGGKSSPAPPPQVITPPPPPPVALPDFSAMFAGPSIDYGAQQRASAAAAAEAAERAAERARRVQGESDTDNLWAQRMDAVGEATGLVDSAIESERSHAALTGQDYAITDELRDERISNQFADLWSSGSESQLEKLTGQFGNPEQEQKGRDRAYKGGGYEWEYKVLRGKEGSESNEVTGGEKVGGPVSKGTAAASTGLLDDEDDKNELLSS